MEEEEINFFPSSSSKVCGVRADGILYQKGEVDTQ